MPHYQDREQKLLKAAIEHGITSRKELANFMAQTSVESLHFSRLSESFFYNEKKRIPVNSLYVHTSIEKVQELKALARKGNPIPLADHMYGYKNPSKKQLGNTDIGDGYRYRGRGFIQLTGKANYARIGSKLNLDLVNHPDLASNVENAVKIALYFWDTNVVSYGVQENVIEATKKINGGKNNLEERENLFNIFYNKYTQEYINSIKNESLNKHNTNINSKLPSRAENLIQQAKEKLIAQCAERGINTTHPDDIDNAATKLASLAYADKMTHIEKVLFNNDCTKLYASSHEPHMQLVSVNANEAVMVPTQESIAQMQKTAQLFAEQAQQKEQQIAQNQNQNKGPKMG